MSKFPNTGAPLWAAAQATPWVAQNEAGFIWDAFAARSIIESRASSTPTGSCADGARYLVKAPATGAWAGHDGQLAIAIGANAANGWYFATVAIHGVQLFVRDEDVLLQHDGTAWITAPGGVSKMDDLTDVSAASPAVGAALVFDGTAWVPQALAAAAPFTVGCFFTTTPAASETLLRYSFAEAVNFGGNFAGAVGKISTNPTISLALTVARNGASIGTVTISTGGSFTFATTGGDGISFSAGDELTIIAPATADESAAGASFTLKGVRA